MIAKAQIGVGKVDKCHSVICQKILQILAGFGALVGRGVDNENVGANDYLPLQILHQGLFSDLFDKFHQHRLLRLRQCLPNAVLFIAIPIKAFHTVRKKVADRSFQEYSNRH